MKIIEEFLAPKNTGWATEMKVGQVLRLTARTIIDFVAFDGLDYGEAFDQAPTKEANRSIYLKRGHQIAGIGITVDKHQTHVGHALHWLQAVCGGVKVRHDVGLAGGLE